MEIASDHEKDYAGHFQRVRQGTDMACFYCRAAARISGRFDPELDLQGIPQPGDIAITAPLSEYTMAVMSDTKAAIEKLGPK